MLSVVLGAFGAHALKSWVAPDKLQIFETGVRYQFMHGMALIALSIFGQLIQEDAFKKSLKWAANFFILGIFLFSGSLYALTLLSNSASPLLSVLGPITPLGGLCFILAWGIWLRLVLMHKVDK
jgi:uncharacterized membrane protein YgdD (TMEM256/DUF423 family)